MIKLLKIKGEEKNMIEMIPQFLVAAPSSGSGKTTVSRGLMAALRRHGYRVQPYKCGPDYIDTKFHETVCGQPSVNLDTFMATAVHVRDIYVQHATTADVCVVEGMMGLFDGYDRDHGSSAEIAALLHLPVVLVVDAASAAYSMAALLHGFMRFRADIKVVGVIFNRVGSANHYRILQEVCSEVGVVCLGYLPKDQKLAQGSRYLGLDFSEGAGEDTQEYLVNLLEKTVNLEMLLQITLRSLPSVEHTAPQPMTGNGHSVVLRDAEAFSFLYTEHLEMLQRRGKVTFLNPLHDEELPADTDFLYLPGGYPEKHAETLSAAKRTLQSIKRYVEAGGRAVAECGGMIYLSQGIYRETPVASPSEVSSKMPSEVSSKMPSEVSSKMPSEVSSKTSSEVSSKTSSATTSFVPLCGVLPFAISALPQHRKLHLGYRQFEYLGQQWRGHEFHYTTFYPEGSKSLTDETSLTDGTSLNDAASLTDGTSLNDAASLPASEVQVYNARNQAVPTPVFRYKNLLASYTHLYWGECGGAIFDF